MVREVLQTLLVLIREDELEAFRVALKKIQLSGEDEEGYLDTCLLDAGKQGKLAFIRMIYEDFGHPYFGVEECYPNCAGNTPFLLACSGGHFEAAKYLLELGANPFAVDDHGCNAVFNAVCSGNVELTKFLIGECKIAWQGFTWEGTSAIQFAEKCGNPQMYDYILSLGGAFYTNAPCRADSC